MDNISHALAGLVIAEAALLLHARRSPGAARGLRGSALFASALANNVPDLDFIYVPITGGKLGYLLHHRGHTHTLVAALPCAVFALAATALFARRTRRDFRRADWLLLIGLCALGPVCHIAMDFSNNYGVHPFWPFDNHWYYGDSVFIIEPWFWVTTLPTLFHASTSRWARALVLILLGGITAVMLRMPFVPFATSGAVVVGALAAIGLLRGRSAGARVAFSVTGSLMVLAALVFSARAARAAFRSAEQARRPSAVLFDVMSTPTPGTFGCFDVLALSAEGDAYRISAARVSALPSLITASACPGGPVGATAGLSPIAVQANASIAWTGEYSARVSELSALSAAECRARAFLRFARAPFLAEHDGQRVIGDLRFDRNPGLDFAELETSGACPRFVPGWLPPTSALIRAPE